MARKRNQPSGSGRVVGIKRVSRPLEPQHFPQAYFSAFTSTGRSYTQFRTSAIDICYWSEIPNDVLERIWNDVKDNVVDCPGDFKSVCFSKYGKMWRDYKSRIKHEEFLPRKNNRIIYEDMPIRVPLSQWKLLVDYWFTEEAQKISEQNANNRRQRGPSCHIGRTHLQELAYQLVVKDKTNDRMSLYIASHDKDHPVFAAHIVEFDRLLDEIPEEDRTVEQCDHIFLEVFRPDEHGYCRSVGSSIHPSIVQSSSSNLGDDLQIFVEAHNVPP